MALTTIRVEQIRRAALSLYRNMNLQNTGVVIKPSSSQLVGVDLYTTNAAERYVKFYDKATPPTASDAVKLTVTISANTPARVVLPGMIPFNTGLSIRATTGSADTDNGIPAANSIFVNVFYE